MNFSGAFRLLALGIIALFVSCDPCENEVSDPIGGEFFTVEYRSPAGENYLITKYNPANVVVYLDSSGGNSPVPKLRLITPGFADGKFGPFTFTERFVNPGTGAINTVQLYGKPYRYNYLIKKDTYGQDTLSVDFLVTLDECRAYWAYIRYSLNGDPLPAYDGQRQAAIVIQE